MNDESTTSENSAIWRHLVIIAILLLLIIGPLFGPITEILGDRFGLETAVILLLFSFIIGFCIILAVIFRFSENRSASLGEQLGNLGLGRPSRLSANIVGALIGLAWGALIMANILQFRPETNLAEFSWIRVAAALLAVFGTILEDLITRGYIMNGLKRVKVPGWGQLVLSALLFALYHTVWSFNAISFVFSVVYGLILSGLFLWGKRSLTPVILAHALAVLISEPFASMLIFIAPGS